MLTGDENIVNIDFSVFWVIKDASKYLFQIQDPEGTVKAAAETAKRFSSRNGAPTVVENCDRTRKSRLQNKKRLVKKVSDSDRR